MTTEQWLEKIFDLIIFHDAALLIYITYRVIIRFLPKWWSDRNGD
jgi:hypothetical protein